MKSIARIQHYLPQAYLAAFTDTESKDGQFYVLNVRNGTTFRTSPKKVAAERDFNLVNIEGETPDVLEKALSPFEERATQAIRNVNRTETFPSNEDYSYIINLICLIAVRNPKLRSSFNQAREATFNIVSDILASNEDIWDHHLKQARDAGYVMEGNVPYEEVKRFVEERRYKIEFSPESNLRVELNTYDKLLKILGNRSWSLLVAPSSGPCFVCSDHPVVLTWKSIDRNDHIGYGLKGTEVFFPFGPRTGFYGVYEEPLHEVVTLTPTQVAMMNSRVVENAERHVFSTKDTFFLLHEDEIGYIELSI